MSGIQSNLLAFAFARTILMKYWPEAELNKLIIAIFYHLTSEKYDILSMLLSMLQFEI